MREDVFPHADDVEWQIRRFLAVLSADENTRLLWSTHDDRRQRDALQLCLHAPLLAAEGQLRTLNARGAGVFVCIARMKGNEHLDRDVRGIRSLVLDLDGPELPKRFGSLSDPHAIVSTSPGRWHCHWRVDGVPIDAFCLIQRRLAALLGGDPSVSVPSQRIRAAGFTHHKRSAYPVRLFRDDIDRPPLAFLDIAIALRTVNADFMDLGSGYWIRDRLSHRIVDHRLLSSIVWHEVLKFDGRCIDDLAECVWRQCEVRADLVQLAPYCSQALAYANVLAAIGALNVCR